MKGKILFCRSNEKGGVEMSFREEMLRALYQKHKEQVQLAPSVEQAIRNLKLHVGSFRNQSKKIAEIDSDFNVEIKDGIEGVLATIVYKDSSLKFLLESSEVMSVDINDTQVDVFVLDENGFTSSKYGKEYDISMLDDYLAEAFKEKL